MRRGNVILCLWVAASVAISSPSTSAASGAHKGKGSSGSAAAGKANRGQAGGAPPAHVLPGASLRSQSAGLAASRRTAAVEQAPEVERPGGATTPPADSHLRQVRTKVAPRPLRAVHRKAQLTKIRIKRSMPRRVWDWLDHAVDVLTLHEQPRLGGRGRVTEERPWFEMVGDAFGIDVGLTVSEINRVAGQGKLEFVHVVGPTGLTQNFETVLKRKEIGHGQRIEVQGPAINTLVGAPIGFRALGLGLTSDLFEPGQRRALSYTLEAKITERAIAYWAPFWAPAVADALAEGGRHTMANLVAGAIPFVSAGLAVQSAIRAYRLFKTPRAGTAEKLLALGHVAADVVRVFMPLVGTLANVGLIATSAGVSWARVKAAKRRAAKEQRPWNEIVPRFERIGIRR